MTHETLSGKVVLVTGAAGGIGAATARLLGLERAALVLTDLDDAGLAHVQLPPGTAALRLAHDVSDPGSWARVVQRALDEHGRLDALVNVAGVVEPGDADAIPLAHLERQVAVNLLGTMLGCRAVLGPMRARGAGAIVNVASLGGIVPMPGEAAYCATKFGVRGWSFSLRSELRRAGVDVSVVSPDSVRTPQLEHELASGSAPMSFVGRAMAPEVVAAAVLRALRTRAPEVLVPASTGLLARAAMAFPAVALPLLSRLERRGWANMARRGAPPLGAASPVSTLPVVATPAPAASVVPSRRARVLGALEIALAIGIAAFWAAFFLLGARAIADPPDEGVYLAFETAFPLADACLALALALAGTGLLRGRPRGRPLSLAAGGALVFLGLLDASFNVLQGMYAAGLPQALGNALVNGACIAGGAAVVAGAWTGERGSPPAGASRHGAWRSGARVRQDGRGRRGMRLGLLLMALAMPALAAGEAGPAAPEEAAAPKAAAATEWYAFALPFYLPETRLGLGATGGVHRVLCSGCEPSSVHVEAAYTLNDQFSLTVAPRLFTSAVFTVAASLHFALFPDRFYGVGPRTGDEGERFTARTLEAMVTPERYVLARRLRVGPKLHLRHEAIVAREPGKLIASGAVPGGAGLDAVGIGASVTWDSRDNQFFPRRGAYLETWYAYYPGVLGHHPAFGRGAVDAARYVTVAGDHVLALDGAFGFTHGDVPFTLLASLGGVRPIRGYADGRYRDACAYGLQAEYRFPIAWRLRGVAFGGVGDVAASPTAFALRTVRAAGGAGLRLRLTDDGVHLRLDLASRGREPDVYMIVLEAF